MELVKEFEEYLDEDTRKKFIEYKNSVKSNPNNFPIINRFNNIIFKKTLRGNIPDIFDAIEEMFNDNIDQYIEQLSKDHATLDDIK